MLQRILCFMAILLLKLRYKVKIHGIEEIKHLASRGGILFLPNHPSEMDPVVLFVYLYPIFGLAPIVADTFFDVPLIGFILKKIVKARGIPNLDLGGNDYTKMLAQRSLKDVALDLKKGANFLIYPAGKLKRSGLEEVGGASGVFQIVQESKEAKVVLIRTNGFWGSSFSRALTGTTPDLLKTFAHSFVVILANLIFFAPKRNISIELQEVKTDLREFKDKLPFNQYLEEWYNLPFKSSGEPLILVRQYFWSAKKPEMYQRVKETIDISTIDESIKNTIIEEIAKISKRDPKELSFETNLSKDLGLDSLDLVELIAFLDDKYEVKNIHPQDLNEVQDLIAALVRKDAKQELYNQKKAWPIEERLTPFLPEGQTIIDVFLQSCKLRGKFSALSDDIVGTITYDRLLISALLLSKKIQKLEGENIGILMPASAGALLLILAVLLANKKPVMLNWTLGSKNLKEVVEASSLKSIVTSLKFLQQARVMDLEGIDHLLVFLEKIKKNISAVDYLKAYFLGKKSIEGIKKSCGIDSLNKDDIAVYLFTSGTESKPKGVPLTHHNILSNLRDAFLVVNFAKEDVVYCFLPPFHSFGFSTTCIFPVLAGIPVAFSPDPTDGMKLAKGLKRYKITILCAAPTFLNTLFRYADLTSLKRIKKVVSGAEKASQSLYEKVESLTSAELLEGYGITECSPILTLNRPGDIHSGVGKPLPHVEVLIVDLSTFEPLKKGKEGLILVRGPNIFNGYLQKKLASPFINTLGKTWYNTADLGYMDENDNLILSGRLKRFVKIGGEMVNLVSIEEGINDYIKNHYQTLGDGPFAAVIAKEIEGQKPSLILYCLSNLDLHAVNQALREHGFSSLIKISEIKQLERLPFLGTGKINYRELQNL